MENSKAVLIAIGASVILLSSLNIFIRDCPIFVGLVPVNTMIANTYAWNVITSCFFETCIPKIAADLMLYYFVSKNLSIGNMEHFFLFMGLSILACTIGTSAFCFIRFFSTKLEEMLLTPVYGFSGVLLCISMFARQQKGNEAIVVNIPFFTFQNFPVAFISIQFVFSLLGVHQMALDLPFTVISLLFSWSYLRFFHRYDDDSIGDKSDDFAFVAMFPPALHPVVVPLTTGCYNIFALCGVFPELEQNVFKKTQHHLRYAEPALPEPLSHECVPNLEKSDLVQERRRAKAMKLLDAKMAELDNQVNDWEAKDDV